MPLVYAVQLVHRWRTQCYVALSRSEVFHDPDLPTSMCVAGVVPFCTLSQHRSRMKCPGVGRSIPKPAGGGSVIPKLISSLPLHVSNCECHIFNDAAFQCGFKLFYSSKESFLLFQYVIFLQPTYKVNALCLKTVAVILFYL